MSSTRRVEEGQRRTQNGWASSPEFDQLRGVNGTAVAMKAALQDSQEKRELLFFIQAHSLRDGGLKRLARDLVEMFPERIGTPAMRKLGCKPGKRLTTDQAKQIWNEIRGRLDWDPDAATGYPVRGADVLISDCRSRAESMDVFFEELCCDPDRTLNKGEKEWYPSVPYFRDVVGALLEYKQHYAEAAAQNYSATSIGKIVFEALDYALETGRSALIEGNSGFGKTTAIKAWHEMHLGQSRYIQLSGITTRGAFLKRVARACGVANGDGLSMERIQYKVEEYLRRTRLVLIIDEGQYLWPQGRRITTHPELINWINTALYNEGVPFAISATKQFSARRQVVEQQTNWSSEQLRRRTRKVFPLPDVPTTDDLRIVARKLLNGLGDAAVDFVSGYAMTSRGYFQAITDAIEDAQLIAKRAGREKFTAKDLQSAIKEWRAPSDAALQRVFDSKPEKQRRSRVSEPQPSDYEPAEETARHTRPLQTSARRETQPTLLVPG